MIMELLPAEITAARLQSRASVNSAYVDELAELMKAGVQVPPIPIFQSGMDQWVPDGLHRLEAAEKAGVKIYVEFHKGTYEQAVEFACRANVSHGLRRSNSDKRQSVTLALTTFPDRSSRAIAELCGVGHQLVEDIRKSSQVDESSTCVPVGENPPTCNGEAGYRVGRDGKRQPASKKPRVSGGTSFDPEELEAAPRNTDRKKAGTSVVSDKDKVLARKHLSELCRIFKRLDIFDEFDASLSQMITRVKSLK